MSRTKKMLLLALCMLCALLVTGCYTDTDPWPEADLNGTQPTTQPTATPVPATEAPATAVPAAPEPLPEDAVDVSPNFNG